jgi:hypothetical protein
MNEEYTTHDLIILTLRKYFEANQKWETKRTHVAATEVRKLLMHLKKLANKRRNEVQAVRITKPKRQGIGQTRETLRSTIDKK